MEQYWQKVNLVQNIKHGILERDRTEVLSTKWKYLIRRGVPMDKMRPILLDIYKRTFTDNNNEYNVALQIACKDKMPDTKAVEKLFMLEDDMQFKELLKIPVLTAEGIEALKRVLLILNNIFNNIKNNLQILQITGILLIFLTEAETYCTLKIMLEESHNIIQDESNQEIQNSLRWFFVSSKPEFTQMCKCFFQTIIEKSKSFHQIHDHFTQISFDYQELFYYLTQHAFFGFLPFPAVLKAFVMFMNEGIKVYLRVMYGICRILKKDLLLITDSSAIKNIIRDKGVSLSQDQCIWLFKKAFSLRIVKSKQVDSLYGMPAAKLFRKQVSKVFYLPNLKKPSNIINIDLLEVIWDWIPLVLKLNEPVLLWTTQVDGFSLNELYKKCQDKLNSKKHLFMLILIKTEKNAIFGAFTDKLFQISSDPKQYYGSNESFVFTLYPQQKKYYSTLQNSNHIISTLDYFSFGSSMENPNNGYALYLDKELNKGFSYKSQTYDNEPLTGDGCKQFTCMFLEVYTFE